MDKASQVINLIANDHDMMDILNKVAQHNLPDWLIGAGFVRNKVWDNLFSSPETHPPSDIDVIYFDPTETINSNEITSQLQQLRPDLIWEVVNQATAHKWNNSEPYISSADALAKWPETVTATGVRINHDHELELVAPHGLDDLFSGIIRPTPYFSADPQRLAKFYHRLHTKKWSDKWPQPQVIAPAEPTAN